VIIKLRIKLRKMKRRIRKLVIKVHRKYIKYITYKKRHPHSHRTLVLKKRWIVAKRRLLKLRRLVKTVLLVRSHKIMKRSKYSYRRALKTSAHYRMKYIQAIKNKKCGKKSLNLWIKAHRKVGKFRNSFRRVYLRHLKKKIFRFKLKLIQWKKKEMKIRKMYFRALHHPVGVSKFRIRFLKKKWKNIKRKIHMLRKKIFKFRSKRISIRIKFWSKKLRIRVRKMLKARKAWRTAYVRGQLTVAFKWKLKFRRWKRKVSVLKLKIQRFKKVFRVLKTKRYHRLYIRANRRVKKLYKLLHSVKHKEGRKFSFCVTILKGEYRKALKISRKYKSMFQKIRAVYH